MNSSSIQNFPIISNLIQKIPKEDLDKLKERGVNKLC
jgi:hypothetical protein